MPPNVCPVCYETGWMVAGTSASQVYMHFCYVVHRYVEWNLGGYWMPSDGR